MKVTGAEYSEKGKERQEVRAREVGRSYVTESGRSCKEYGFYSKSSGNQGKGET